MIASGGQWRVRNTHASIPSPPNSFPSRLPHNIKPRFLCYAVGQCCLSILNIVYIHLSYYAFKHSVYMSIPNSLSFPPSFTPATINSFSKSVKLLVLWVHLYHFFLDSTNKGCCTIFLLLCLTYFTQYDNYCSIWKSISYFAFFT